MDQRDYELQRIKNINKILKNILVGIVSLVLIFLFIKYNPDYDTNFFSMDTAGFVLFIANSLYLLNQIADIFERSREIKKIKEK